MFDLLKLNLNIEMSIYQKKRIIYHAFCMKLMDEK